MHAANIPIPIPIANEAMGHTIEVHLKSYARFKPSATAELVAAVKVCLVNQVSLGSGVTFTGHFTDE